MGYLIPGRVGLVGWPWPRIIPPPSPPSSSSSPSGPAKKKSAIVPVNSILCFWGDFSLRIEISMHSARHPMRIFGAHLLGGCLGGCFPTQKKCTKILKTKKMIELRKKSGLEIHEI